MDNLSAPDLLALVTLGVLLGVVGQFARLAGELADPENTSFDGRRVAMSVFTAVVVGAAAGGIGAVTFLDEDKLARENVIALIGAGYVGGDFIEQFLKRRFASLRSVPPAATPPAD